MNKKVITEQIKNKALEIGFDKVGIAKAESLDSANLESWLGNKYHGDMLYMENHFDKRTDPTKLVKGAQSVISVALNYNTPFKHSDNAGEGKISRYAWGDDYHDIVRKKLKHVLNFIMDLNPATHGRVFVDSAPIMDKQWAIKAGIGWQGKNSNVITREMGSWIFLGEIVIDLVLEYDTPISDFCGTCNKCIQACPTNAITKPYVVDATRCISYLTIELKQIHDIPDKFKSSMENHIFGCDICQDVCPWNKKFAKVTTEKPFYPRKYNLNPNLEKLSGLTLEEFRERNKKSPVKRPKYDGFMRNVKIALDNFLKKKSHLNDNLAKPPAKRQ